jgi:p-hydroxybenzoate 3-monooxygenase
MRTQVGIIGAGPAGLFLAHLLHLEGIEDMVAARLRDGGQIEFEASVDRVEDITSNRPKIHYRQGGQDKVLECDFIGGCDGFHGISRPSLPADLLVEYDRVYPFGWLGILAESPPPDHELIYSYTDRGFALYSMRARHISRLYLQCDPEEDLSQWPDERIWDELDKRLQGTRPLQRGKVVQKGVTAMRSFVAEPMQHGRLFLAGDAAHIVPPTGAKGMNLAVADVLRLSRAIAEYYRDGGTDLIEGYSAVCLRRIWKAQRFSWWMTQLLHLDSTQNAFDRKRQLAELDYVTSSDSAERTLAENYVGLPID